MAIDQGSTTRTITAQERTWRVNIETPRGADPVVTVFRETIKADDTGAVVSREQAPIAQRSLSSVAAEQQPFTPSVAGQITAAELATLISARADMWREQDIANPHP